MLCIWLPFLNSPFSQVWDPIWIASCKGCGQISNFMLRSAELILWSSTSRRGKSSPVADLEGVPWVPWKPPFEECA